MAEISAQYSRALALTLFTVSGSVTADDLIAAMEGHFPAHPSRISIWDLWHADLSGLDLAELVRISDCARRFAKDQDAPQTAFVVKRAQEKPLVKLYEQVDGVRGSPTRYRLHPSVAAAYEDLGLKDPFAAQRESA